MMVRQIADDHAMNLIYEAMSGEEWSPDTLEAIADIVGLTGRVIEDSGEVDV